MVVLVALAAAVLGLPLAVSATTSDPCAKIGGKAYVLPSDALACQKSFPFNETLRQNVLTNVAKVLDNFFSFETYYKNSPAPFQESTVDIHGEIARINSTYYATDYDFNKDVYDFTTVLNDGHTRWFPNCYTTFQNLLPAPIVSLAVKGVQNVYVIPDLVDFLGLLGTNYTSNFDAMGYDWKRLAGAKVLQIAGQNAYDYVDHVARTQSGNYLDHGVRVNSVYSSYRIQSGFSQRFGDFAGPSFPTLDNITMTVVVANSSYPETVTVPFYASFVGANFTDGASYWANNCAVTNTTNGVNYSTAQAKGENAAPRKVLGKASLFDMTNGTAVGLPPKYQPGLPTVGGDKGVIKSYILPDNKTGVMFVGSFEPTNYTGFENDVVTAVAAMKAKGVKNLLVDVTNNGGGYICLGAFLHQYLAGSRSGYPGFQSTMRASPIAQRIVAQNIKLNLVNLTNYDPTSWAYLNDTTMSPKFNYMSPPLPVTVNGVSDPTSQRFHDICTPFDVPIPKDPPFAKVAVMGNGNCASTCAFFTTVMNERYGTKMAVFGGEPSQSQIQFKGMAGNQVLEWADLDSEIITAGLQNDPDAPPQLLINGNMRVNWRTAWSYKNEQEPIAYRSEAATQHWPYTIDTYNNPLNAWKYAASKLF